MEEEEKLPHVKEEDEESFKTRSEEEDEMYLEALMKEAQGGSISKATISQKVEIDSPEQPVQEIAKEAEEKEDIPTRLPEEVEEVEEEIIEEVIEEIAIEEEAIEEEAEQIEEEAATELQEEPEKEHPEEEDDGGQWEDPFEDDDSVAVKKYIFGVSLDYVDLIDEMDLDERSAFINDAIYIKLEKERKDAKKHNRNSLVNHVMLIIVALVIGFPLLSWVAAKSIEITSDNYKRMRSNVETLYTGKVRTEAAIRHNQDEMRK